QHRADGGGGERRVAVAGVQRNIDHRSERAPEELGGEHKRGGPRPISGGPARRVSGDGVGESGRSGQSSASICMTTALGSVKNSRRTAPPARPTPDAPTPPNGARRSRMKKQFTHAVPARSAAETRCARLRFSVNTMALSP